MRSHPLGHGRASRRGWRTLPPKRAVPPAVRKDRPSPRAASLHQQLSEPATHGKRLRVLTAGPSRPLLTGEVRVALGCLSHALGGPWRCPRARADRLNRPFSAVLATSWSSGCACARRRVGQAAAVSLVGDALPVLCLSSPAGGDAQAQAGAGSLRQGRMCAGVWRNSPCFNHVCV